MADNRNFAALDWLIHEIGETLKEARQSLEIYVENPKDTARIRFCLTHIHQVHGSLQMVEFYGAAMLAEEMEKLTQAMINDTVANPAEAHEVLMRAILQFPVYLEQVKATRKDNPLIVLPLLNDLRAVRGESLLTDTKLFVPNLAPAKRISGARLPAAQDNLQFQDMVKKLRQMYQYSAAGFIRGVNPDENLAYLQKVFSRLYKLTQGTARQPLWDICLALAEALQMDAIEISVSVKNLLRQLDKEIKILVAHGTKALDAFTKDELIKNLLYYVARSGKHAADFPPNSHLKRIYESYQLEAALVEGKDLGQDAQNFLSAPDSDAIRSVVGALKGELDLVKNALDVCLSGGDTNQALSDALPVMKRIADTMAVLGIGELRKQVLEQAAVLERVVESNSQLSHDQLMSVADKVMELEHALESMAEQSSQSGQSEGDITLSRAKESVLRESRNGLEHAKDAITEYIASQGDRVHLQTVPATLREIRGGLEIMPLPRPGRVLGACARYIEEQLLTQEKKPEFSKSLDTLADAITSVEYYLERLSSGAPKEENDLLLTLAEDSVASLGYAVAKIPRAETPAASVEPEPKAEQVSSWEETPLDADDNELPPEDDEAALAAAYQSALQPSDDNADEGTYDNADENADSITDAPIEKVAGNYSPAFESDTVEADDEINIAAEAETETEAYDYDLQVAEDDAAEEIQASTTEESVEEIDFASAPEPARPTPSAVVDDEDDGDEIDDEIIEIFVEEASEVTHTIGEFFPLWAQNFNDSDSLTEFRRAFHTLKGSGRMVGANDIGELAWSIENMLNRIIDGSITAGAPHIAIIEKVRLLLPGMINAFSLHQPNPEPVLSEAYRSHAEALAKGLTPPDLDTVVERSPVQQETLVDEDDVGLEQEEEHEEALDLEPVAEEIEPEEAEEITYSNFINATNDEAIDETEDDELTAIEDDEIISYDEVAAPDELDSSHYRYSTEPTDIDDADAQLWDIFGAEALTHLDVMKAFIQRMEEIAPFYEPPSEEIQRALHTLKGSAHMADIKPVAELATPLEKFVKELRSYQLNINDDILQLTRDAVAYTHIALDNISNKEPVEIPRLHQFLARVQELRDIHVAPLARQLEADAAGKRPIDPELLAIFMAEEMNLLLNADNIIAQWQFTPDDLAQLKPLSNELRNLTHGAAHAYLHPMANLGEKLQQVYQLIFSHALTCNDDLCSTLNAAHHALLDMVDAVAAGQNLNGIPAAINEPLDALIASASAHSLHEEMTDELSEVTVDESAETVADEESIVENELSSSTDASNADTYFEEITFETADDEEITFDTSEAIPETTEDTIENTAEEITFEATDGEEISYAAIDDEEISLATEEAAVDDDTEQELLFTSTAEEQEIVFEPVEEEPSYSSHKPGDAEEAAAEEISYESIEDELVFEAVEDEESDDEEISYASLDEENSDEEENLFVAEDEESLFVSDDEESLFVSEDQEVSYEPLTDDDIATETDADVPSWTPQQNTYAEDDSEAEVDEVDEDFDPEIVEIFIEEAGELLEDIERALHEWQEDWNNTEPVEDLKRSLHTFKGGARLAGLTDIGDISHEFESVLIDMDRSGDIDQNFFKRLTDYQDRLLLLVDRARAKLAGEYVAPLDLPAFSAPEQQDVTTEVEAADEMPAPSSEHASEHDFSAPTPETTTHDFTDHSKVIPFTPKPKSTPTPAVPALAGLEKYGMRAGPNGGAAPAPIQHLAARRTGPQEVVKVSAELLEELVNLAGETSISRGRMEQQVSDLGSAIEEMDSTIQRLQEQLRRLDIETEAQIIFRQEQMSAHEDFDPLEMDRYSQLQQLSRSLIESASDLMDLKYTLADKTRDTETLLLQQSRINTDLQEGLMRSRMVPFSRLVPRLRRIVRQAATELGKEVDFELDNVEGEMDRTVLERMVAPLEHMLRNAVDHGIESADDRVAAGKPAAGRIVLTLGREGGDVMLRLADDGRGINLTRVREKAIERGLMTASAQLSDQDVIQFILHAGFSTADKVTQISGRGVGMDVVHSEIKQLGGAMFIDSTWGHGTEFTVRLPFTVSVNRALMVQIGDDLYAIPLNTIEGIVRVSPFELEHYYQDEHARFEYAGENYLVRYLGTMLDSEAKPKLDGQSLPLPVVLVRSAENTVALQVDRLLGSREIVVKTLGAQFSAVRGVSGATVMGDGSVVVILDLHALIREQLALGLNKSLLLEPLVGELAHDDMSEKTVMVVDDSVTVRKVTSRFLEREGFHVITAKDGAEAMLLLQDHLPDVMLLDIEMPRMDGFEVAKNVRTSSRLKGIPIIMITSRTGDKHRERALSLGVNKYMGKPYQEDLLLSNIQELLGKPSR